MNNSYEKVKVLYLVMFFIFIVLFCCIGVLLNKKIYQYRVFDGIVFSDNLIIVMVDKSDLELFYDNSFVFIDNKKIRFDIHNINKDVLKRDNVVYSEIYLKIKFAGYKENDVVKFSVLENKIYSYKLFDVIWR